MSRGRLASPELVRAIVDGMKARAADAGVTFSAELLPRLEEVSAFMAEAVSLRLAGAPDPDLEQVLQARLKLLSTAGALEVADLARDAARDALVGAVHLAFRAAVGLVA